MARRSPPVPARPDRRQRLAATPAGGRLGALHGRLALAAYTRSRARTHIVVEPIAAGVGRRRRFYHHPAGIRLRRRGPEARDAWAATVLHTGLDGCRSFRETTRSTRTRTGHYRPRVGHAGRGNALGAPQARGRLPAHSSSRGKVAGIVARSMNRPLMYRDISVIIDSVRFPPRKAWPVLICREKPHSARGTDVLC